LLKFYPDKIAKAESSATISKMLSKDDISSDDYTDIISEYILNNFI